MKVVISVFTVLVALVLYDYMETAVPEAALDKTPIRELLYQAKNIHRQADLYSLLYGQNRIFHWIRIIRSQAEVRNISIIEDGMKIYDTFFADVPVRVYEPLGKIEEGPGLIWMHSGGWIVGSIEHADKKCKHMAKHMNLVVVSINYRLAPEHPYPVPFQDCLDAVIYFLNKAQNFGVDPKRIALSGDSAGGNFAAAISLKLRDLQKKPKLKLQVMIYPVTQALDFELDSFQQNEFDPLLPKEDMVAMWLLYATGSLDGLEEVLKNKHVTADAWLHLSKYFELDSLSQRSKHQFQEGNGQLWNRLKRFILDPYFCPLFAEDLSDLPPAFVFTSEQDVLRDEGALYAHRLKLAGNNVTHHHEMTAFHGLISFGEISLDQQKADSILYTYIMENL